MNPRQIEALNKHEPELGRRLKPSVKSLLAQVLAEKVISQTERDEIDAITISTDKLTNLLLKLKSKENGFSALVAFLRHHDGAAFADTFENAANENGQSTNGRARTLWGVPLPNRYFTGRETLINQLLKSFEQLTWKLSHVQAKSSTTVLSTCHGLGGVGKTQLATEFVYRYQEKFYDVFWFPAEDCSQIEIAYKKLAEEFKINAQQPIDDIVQKIKAWFSANPGCLLIYDNASSSDVILKYMPEKGCCVLITSRNTTKWYRIGNEFTVDVFELAEATDYLTKKLVDEVGNQKVQELAKRMGYLPLALAEACAYMKEKQVTISDYLCLYEKEKERLLSEEILPKNEHEPVFITWNITMKTIKEESSFSAYLLYICSYLHSEDIPDFLLRRFTENREINPKKEVFEDSRGILAKYSMIKVNKPKHTISLHQILQEVMRLQLEKQSNQIFFLVLTAVLEEYPHGDILMDYEKQILFVPHLESVLHHFKWRSEDWDLLKLIIIAFLGETYLKLGNYAGSRDKSTEALVIKEKHYGSDHPEAAKTLVNLSNAYGSLGDYTKQREYLERALGILEKHYGSDHPEVAKTLGSLGNAYGSLGDYTKQREYLERALVIEEIHYGSDHPEVAKTLVNLSNAYGSLGDYTKQREYLERALGILEKHYGSDHPEVAMTIGNLGIAYGSLGDYNKKREYLERALVIQEKHYGSDHPEVAMTIGNLGIAYGSLGDYTKQREHLERALVILEKHYGPDHPIAVNVKEILAMIRKLNVRSTRCIIV